MKVSELITILNTFEKDSDVIIYNDSTDASYEICCIDTDESDDTESNPKVVIFFLKASATYLYIISGGFLYIC